LSRIQQWIRPYLLLYLLTLFHSPNNDINSGCHALAAVPLPPMTTTAPHLPLARRAMDYFDKSTDPFHAVQTSVDLLKQAGFQELDDLGKANTSDSTVRRGGKYFYTRNKSTLVAFAVGHQYSSVSNSGGGGGGFKIIGGHTDSPNLKVKPRSKRSAKSTKSIQIGVECYGGGLWHTWFDRDLGLSGRVFIRSNDSSKIEQRLLQVHRAVLRIPNLAIHLQTDDERKAFTVNKEDHLSPILAMTVQKALSGDQGDDGDDAIEKTKESAKADGWTEHQEPLLLQLLAAELNVPVEDIVDFELNLFDIQVASLGGVHSEFVHSARLDNLASCFLAVQALVDCVQQDDYLQQDRDISMVILYDHEEVGSSSA
jgi:aspartyl aminopeptidase